MAAHEHLPKIKNLLDNTDIIEICTRSKCKKEILQAHESYNLGCFTQRSSKGAQTRSNPRSASEKQFRQNAQYLGEKSKTVQW